MVYLLVNYLFSTMAPVSEEQTLSEKSRPLEGVIMNNSSVQKLCRRQGDGTDSRGGRKRHAGILPSCQVCFNPGSGFHYGADTCEPCKTFFRRNVSLKGKLECRRGNSCKPAPAKKFKCTACRLNRCLKVGMSLEGIKLGRYTDSKRAKNKTLDADPPLATPILPQSAPHSPPAFMTPPDTPTDQADDTLSPQPAAHEAEETSEVGSGLDSDINKAINFLTGGSVPFQGQDLTFQSNYSAEDLSITTQPMPLVKQDIGMDLSLGSNLSSGFCQKGQLMATDFDSFSLGLPSVSESNMLQTSSLLDSILYDNITGPNVVPSVTMDSNAGLDLSMIALGGTGLVNMSSVDNSTISQSNITDLNVIGDANSHTTSVKDKPENTNPIPTTAPSTTRASVSVLESPLTAIQRTVTSSSSSTTQTALTQPRLPAIPTPVSGTTSIFLDTFIDHITNIYNHYDAHGSDFFRQMHKLFFEYLETQSMKKRMFGSMRPLPLPEYREILMETGLDVDGRLQQLTHRQLPNYEKGYSLYLNFVRDVPGFRDLPMEDQDILIKGGRIDYWMLSEFDCFNVEMGLHAMPDGFVMGVEDKALVFGRNFIRSIFIAAGKFQKLGLSERERNLLKCIYIFSRGNSCSTPEGIATTEKHYAFFRQVLQYCREREGRLAMSNEMDDQLDPLMKELGQLEEKDWEEFFALWKDFPMIKFPPVTKSFYFGSPTSDHGRTRVS